MTNYLIPKIGSRWKHKSGTIYQVVLVSNLMATKQDYPIIISYKDDENNVWARDIIKWQEMREVND